MTNYELIKSRFVQPEKIDRHMAECPSFDFEVLEILKDGSEKQISWATQIYIDYVKEFSKWAYKHEKGFKNIEQVKNILNKIFNNDSAKYWIDNRDKDIMILLNNAIK